MLLYTIDIQGDKRCSGGHQYPYKSTSFPTKGLG